MFVWRLFYISLSYLFLCTVNTELTLITVMDSNGTNHTFFYFFLPSLLVSSALAYCPSLDFCCGFSLGRRGVVASFSRWRWGWGQDPLVSVLAVCDVCAPLLFLGLNSWLHLAAASSVGCSSFCTVVVAFFCCRRWASIQGPQIQVGCFLASALPSAPPLPPPPPLRQRHTRRCREKGETKQTNELVFYIFHYVLMY